MNLIDHVTSAVSPEAGLRRARARAATVALTRRCEGASVGRRTEGWITETWRILPTAASEAQAGRRQGERSIHNDKERQSPERHSVLRRSVQDECTRPAEKYEGLTGCRRPFR